MTLSDSEISVESASNRSDFSSGSRNERLAGVRISFAQCADGTIKVFPHHCIHSQHFSSLWCVQVAGGIEGTRLQHGDVLRGIGGVPVKVRNRAITLVLHLHSHSHFPHELLGHLG